MTGDEVISNSTNTCKCFNLFQLSCVTSEIILWNNLQRVEGSPYLVEEEGRLKRNFRTKEMISIFPLWTFHLYVVTFQQHLHMEYISLSWYDIPEFVVPIRMSLVLDRELLLTRKLLNQGFLLVKLKSSLRKFYGHHHDLVDRYGIYVSQMTTDMFHLS